MKTFVILFLSSAIFGIVIAIVYWGVSREPIGTFLLGIMAAALIFAAGYAVVAERDADLDGDDPNMLQSQAAGEDLGTFTIASAYPILIAISALFALLGALWSPFLMTVALIALVLCLWRLGAESARVN
jgi:Cytochrome c oxidase subunit IV